MLKRNPATQKVFFGIAKARAQLINQGVDPTPENLSKLLGVSAKLITDIEPRLRHDALLDAPVNNGDDESSPLGDMIADDSGVQPDVRMEGDEFRAALRERMERFTATVGPREAEIIRARLLSPEPETLSDLGRVLGVTRERVRQLETLLKRRLKHFLEQELGDTIEAQYGEPPRDRAVG
jgi:RNA polymerase sigma-32 factor